MQLDWGMQAPLEDRNLRLIPPPLFVISLKFFSG